MARALVVPDVHLKPWMFDLADKAARDRSCDVVVVLGDLVDDWGCGLDSALYAETVEAAGAFARRHPRSLWCYGNHDWAYLHADEGCRNSGFSEAMRHLAGNLLGDFYGGLGGRAAVVHRVDNAVFSHAGVGRGFVEAVRGRLGDDLTAGECIEFANGPAGSIWLFWREDSPMWLRPGNGPAADLGEGVFQVAGHTPVPEQGEVGGILLVDTFSTRPDGSPVGNRRLTVVDTDTGEWSAA